MSVFSEESLQLRRELAYACRILAAHGQNDNIYGHVTHREAGAQTFWMNPAAVGLEEMRQEALIRVALEGNVVEGELPRHLDFPLHAEIFRARPTITCVVHTHPIYSIAFAATGQPLHAVSHEGAQFTPPDVPRFTRTSDLITTRELGEEVASTMSGSLACYLINHGIVVAGNTIDKAVVSAINLERASQVQLLAAASRQSFSWTSDEEIAGKRAKILGEGTVTSVRNYYCRCIRPL